MMDEEFVARLRCPVNGVALRLADPDLVREVNEAIRAGSAVDVTDQTVHEPIEGGLTPEGGDIVYPIRDGIPTLVADDAIRIPGRSS